MDNIPVPENIVSQEKVSKKSSLLKILIPLILLLILGGLGFVFKDRVLDLIQPYLDEKDSIVVNSPEPEDDFSPFPSYFSDFSEEDSYLNLDLDYEYLKNRYTEEEIDLLVPKNPDFPYLYLSGTDDNIGADLQIKLVPLQPIYLESYESNSRFFIKVAIRDENNIPATLDVLVGSLEESYDLLNYFTLIEQGENVSKVEITKLQDTYEKGDQIRVILVRNVPFGLEPFESSELRFCEGIEQLCQMIKIVVDSYEYYPLIPAVVLDRNLRQE